MTDDTDGKRSILCLQLRRLDKACFTVIRKYPCQSRNAGTFLLNALESASIDSNLTVPRLTL